MEDDYKTSVRGKASGSIHNLHTALDRDPVVAPERRRTRSTENGSGPQMGGASFNTEYSDQSYRGAANRLRDLMSRVETVGGAKQNGRGQSTGGGVIKQRDEILFDNQSADGRKSDAGRPTTAGLIDSSAQPITGLYGSRVEPAVRQLPGDRPSSDEAVRILQHEASRVQHLETEKRFLLDEMRILKQKTLGLIEENQSLHAELRRSVVHEISSAGINPSVVAASATVANPHFLIPSQMFGAPDSGSTRANTGSLPTQNKFDYSRWRVELEKIQSLHVAKTSRLEAQLQQAREEADRGSAELRELQSRLRILESSLNHSSDPSMPHLALPVGGGLCITCAEREAVLPLSVSVLQKKHLDSVTRDRDDLLGEVEVLKRRYEEMRQKEEGAYAEIKSSIQLAEQAHLEMTQAVVEREQFREEVEMLTQRLQDQILDAQRKIHEQSQLVRAETQNKQNDLNRQIRELMEQLAGTQVDLEKIERERNDYRAEVSLLKDQLSSSQTDYTKAVEEMRVGSSQIRMDRNIAVQQAERLKQELEQCNDDRHAERQRMREEIEQLRKRLDTAERNLLTSKDECLRLYNENQNLQRELHSSRLTADGVESSRADELTRAERRAEQREVELNALIDNLQTKHARTTGELEEYVGSHESLVQKLREECRNLVSQLENVSNRYKSDNKKLRSAIIQLREQLARSQSRCKELTEQHSQQGLVQEKMRQRINAMDSHSQNNSQQILDLLSKESILMRERRELVNHIDFLHRQIQQLSGLGMSGGVALEAGLSSGEEWMGTQEAMNFMNLYQGPSAAVQDIISQVRQEGSRSEGRGGGKAGGDARGEGGGQEREEENTEKRQPVNRKKRMKDRDNRRMEREIKDDLKA